MRTKLIAGNWKMHTDLRSGTELLNAIIERLHNQALPDTTEIVVCPPLTHLATAQAFLLGGRVRLGAQNMHQAASGAYTGEVSAPMLRSVGCQYVIIGHSERRNIFAESDYDVCKKTNAAIDHGLKPIICVGETISEREAGDAAKVVSAQLDAALEGLFDFNVEHCVIAYEPIWAIGTGQTATPEQAQQIHAVIRARLASLFNDAVAGNIRILYGGSVTPDNAKALFSQPDIDGGLVGGASLKADSFVSIILSAS